MKSNWVPTWISNRNKRQVIIVLGKRWFGEQGIGFAPFPTSQLMQELRQTSALPQQIHRASRLMHLHCLVRSTARIGLLISDSLLLLESESAGLTWRRIFGEISP